MRVQVPPRPLGKNRTLAYIVGIALGDGNLSNPNGRAIRLRITCDTRYPKLKKQIIASVKKIFPNNKVSIILRAKSFHDISVYSNHIANILPWQVGKGSKIRQNVRVPRWIFSSKSYIRECLRGLLQTDGSIYRDRGYIMTNFSNNIKALADDVFKMITMLGYTPTFHIARSKERNTKYTVRIVRNSEKFIKEIKLVKA